MRTTIVLQYAHPDNKKPRLDVGAEEVEVGKVAEEDEDSEPSDEEDDDW